MARLTLSTLLVAVVGCSGGAATGGGRSCDTCESAGYTCGGLADGCGEVLFCGNCMAPDECGRGGVPGQCGCTPTTCLEAERNCGTIDDGCGGSLDCGECEGDSVCGAGGVVNVCSCAPTTCAELGKDCGVIDDGCGGSKACGSCTAPESCGGVGEDDVCGCVPLACGERCGTTPDGCGGTLGCGGCASGSCGGAGPNLCGEGRCSPVTDCASVGKDCGTISDGCAGVLDCGGCHGGTVCGGGGEENVCACKPQSCEQLGAECGSIDDGCGMTLSCPDTCLAPASCAGAGAENRCGCAPTSCALAGKDCGRIADGCGGSLDCGETCPLGQVCGGGGVTNVCGEPGSCTPRTCEGEGKDCGSVDDGCGGALACGSCDEGVLCGGTGVKNVCGVDTLASASGCAGVFNPEQLLDFHLTMAGGDWAALTANLTNDLYFPAQFRCGDEPPLGFDVAVRRKRSGSMDKPGLKIDFNGIVGGEAFYTLKKLSLENGVSEGSETAERSDLVAEYMAWRVMVLSEGISSRAAFARLFVNGALVGLYVNVEQVDRRFLRSRLGEDTGWLYKKSGTPNDGYKTNTTEPNPQEDDLCFLHTNCAPPAAPATYLPQHVDVTQLLHFGGMNAVLANSDSPFEKDNNYYWYDRPGSTRLYIPWDLDTVMKSSQALFSGHTNDGMRYFGVLFPTWEDDYDVMLTTLLGGPLSLAALHGELERVDMVAGAALDDDPAIGGDSTADVVAAQKGWWTTRHAQLSTELAGHAP